MKTNIEPADSWSYRCSVAHRTRRANLTTNYGVNLSKICYRRFGMSKAKKLSMPYYVKRRGGVWRCRSTVLDVRNLGTGWRLFG
jgi:hypothetical protein